MKFSLQFILFSFLSLAIATSLCAETRYISDQLLVTVRSGKGNQFKILETLPTSTPVTVLEVDKNYVKVLTAKGAEGYILRHYVTKSLPKKVQITQLKKEIASLQQQLETRQQEFQASLDESASRKTQLDELSTQLDQARQSLEKKEIEYKTLLSNSENVLSLTEESQQLVEENSLLNSELLILREENQNFHRSNMIQWFLAGAGVFLGGWIIGKISRKKQRRY